MTRFPPPFRASRKGLLLFCVIVLCLGQASGTFLPWLTSGAWLEYKFKLYSLRFLNGTVISSDSGIETTFRIECLGVEGNATEMNVALKTVDSSVYLSTKVYVNAETRSVMSLDRKRVGETLLWLPANPEKGESLVLIDNQTVNVDLGGFMGTCQGFQKFFHVLDSNHTIDAAYDLDTGVLLHVFFRREATMQALNISGFVADSMKLTATNVNLGPREWLPEIVYAIPLLLPLIGFLSILTFVLLRNRRRPKKAIASSIRKKRR